MIASPALELWMPPVQKMRPAFFKEMDESCVYLEDPWVNSTVVDSLHKNAALAHSAALTESLARLERLQELEDNWDDAGALAVSSQAINSAKSFILDVSEKGTDPEFVVAGKSGGVVVEYRGANDRSIEIEFESDGGRTLLVFEGSEMVHHADFKMRDFRSYMGLASSHEASGVL